MSHSEATLEPELQPARRRLGVRWSWWLLIVLAVVLVVVVWSRASPLDSRLIGEWTFMSTDGSGIRKFLTLSGNGTAMLDRVMPGSAVRTPDTLPMTWWMEGDVLMTQQIENLPNQVHQFISDVITQVRLKKREDRSVFQLKVVHLNDTTVRVSEVTAGVPVVEIEMTRVEGSKGF